jgi:pSer/pThr/pTyr-binding forkhead associated (FHA) protein
MPVSILIRSSATKKDAADPPALTFDGSRIVIGRGAGSEVRLPEVSVSHRHASVRASGSDYVLVDEGSTNGTVIGGERLAPHTPRVLRAGDLVRVGRVWLEVRFDQKPPTRDLSAATRDIALALVAEAMAAAGDDVVPRARVVEGPDLGATLRLAEDGHAYVVGRGEDTDLPLADAEASRHHLQITRRGNTVFVRDLDSKNVAHLGGAPLPSDKDVAWRGQAVVRIASTVLALDEPVTAALADLEGAADELVPVADAPPPPPPSAAVPALAGAALPVTSSPAVAVPGQLDVTVKLARARRSRWTGTDFAVVLAALGVIALSAAGLYWLLKP